MIKHCIADSSSHLKVSIIVPTIIASAVYSIAGVSAAAFLATFPSAVVASVPLIVIPLFPSFPRAGCIALPTSTVGSLYLRPPEVIVIVCGRIAMGHDI